MSSSKDDLERAREEAEELSKKLLRYHDYILGLLAVHGETTVKMSGVGDAFTYRNNEDGSATLSPS